MQKCFLCYRNSESITGDRYDSKWHRKWSECVAALCSRRLRHLRVTSRCGSVGASTRGARTTHTPSRPSARRRRKLPQPSRHEKAKCCYTYDRSFRFLKTTSSMAMTMIISRLRSHHSRASSGTRGGTANETARRRPETHPNTTLADANVPTPARNRDCSRANKNLNNVGAAAEQLYASAPMRVRAVATNLNTRASTFVDDIELTIGAETPVYIVFVFRRTATHSTERN